MIDCVVDIFLITCFRALGLSPSSWGLWHSGCVMNTPEMQGSWFELFFPLTQFHKEMCTVYLTPTPAGSALSCINGEKNLCASGATLPGKEPADFWLPFSGSTAQPPAHKPVLSAPLALEAKPLCTEVHSRTGLPLLLWSWMQDVLHIQTALTSVMLIACLCCRPLLPIISDGLLA